MKSHRSKGFSLVELMVAVAIVGILAAIALPSYSSYQIRASRAAAQTELLQLASLQEKIYLNSNAYTASVTLAYNGRIDTDATTPGGLGKSTSNDGKYTFAIVNGGQTYTMTAVPVAGKAQVDDGCLLIRENGVREWHQGSDTCTAAAPTAW